MIESSFMGCNDYPLVLEKWTEVANPVGIVIIVHGMYEHMGRYDEMSTHLNCRQFLVAGFDLRCMGKTCGDKFGIPPEGSCFDNSVQDVIKLTESLIGQYDLPVFLYGYDYGALITQKVIECASELYSGVIFSGLLKISDRKMRYARLANCLSRRFYSKNKPAKFITKMWYAKLNKQSATGGIDNSWLSTDREQVEIYNNDSLCGKYMSIAFYDNLLTASKNLYNTQAISMIRKNLPILILAGEGDSYSMFSGQVSHLYDTLTENALAKVKLKIYPSANHALHMEKKRKEIFGDIADYYCSLLTV